jgi:hypothetical protein
MMPERPSAGRVAAALLAASAAAPSAFGLMLVAQAPREGFWLLLAAVTFGFPVALLHALLLALPAYAIVRRWWRLKWWNAAATGFLIGVLPASLLVTPSFGTLMAGGGGLVGGLVFWLVLRGARGEEASDDLRRTFA